MVHAQPSRYAWPRVVTRTTRTKELPYRLPASLPTVDAHEPLVQLLVDRVQLNRVEERDRSMQQSQPNRSPRNSWSGGDVETGYWQLVLSGCGHRGGVLVTGDRPHDRVSVVGENGGVPRSALVVIRS
jgi:hypothetical protein